MKKYLSPLIVLIILITTMYIGVTTSKKKLYSKLENNCIKSFNGRIVKLAKEKVYIKLTLDTKEDVFFYFSETGRDTNNSQVFIEKVHIGDLFIKEANKQLFITKDSNSVTKEWLMWCNY